MPAIRLDTALVRGKFVEQLVPLGLEAARRSQLPDIGGAAWYWRLTVSGLDSRIGIA